MRVVSTIPFENPFWQLLNRLSHGRRSPGICGGGFDDILYAHEKKGCEIGALFKWVNFGKRWKEQGYWTLCFKEGNLHGIMEWKGELLFGRDWYGKFPNTKIVHGSAAFSDHVRLFVYMERRNYDGRHKRKGQKPCRCKTLWHSDGEYKEEVDLLWGGMHGGNFGLVKTKLKHMVARLHDLGRRKYRSMDKKITQLKKWNKNAPGEWEREFGVAISQE